MAQRAFDVIVLGVGAMGSSACFHLARRGVSVLGLEQFGIPHAFGSHHGDSRIIRLCYYEHADYVPLLRRAYELWHELENHSAQRLLHMTGGIYMGAPQSEFVAGAIRAARAHGLEHDALDARALQQRFPQFRLPGEYAGVWEPNAGFLLPEKCVAAYASLAMRHGAEIHGCERVIDWREDADGQGVRVRTSHDEYAAGRLVIAAGAWTSALARDLGVPLKVTRQIVGWVQPRRPELFAHGVLPIWAIDHPDGTQHYGFPMLEGEAFGSARPGLKIAHHWHGPATSVDTIDRAPQPHDEQDFRGAIREFLPDADGPLLSMSVCMYTCTTDCHFVVDQPERLSGARRVTIACGFSGHGFKFASVMGEILADLALEGGTRHPIDFLRAGRFAGAGSHAR